jgi:ParB/RepB/Spo0J family partition protein
MKLDPKLQAQLGAMFATPEGECELPGALMLVDVAKIHTGAQPRKHFGAAALRDLENSIRELNAVGKGIGGSGILQPLLVRSGGDSNYIVTVGERRLRAAKAAGLKQVPVVVDENDDEGAWEHAIIENIVRSDLGPVEEAEAIQKLMQSRGYSVREAAKRLGKDKGYLENRLFLLKAPEDVRDMVLARTDTIRHAREIAKVDQPKARQGLIEAAVAGASFGIIQERVQDNLKPKPGKAPLRDNQVSARADSAKRTSLDNAFAGAQDTLATAIEALKNAAPGLSPNKKVRSNMLSLLEKQVCELQDLIKQLRL